MRVRARSTVTLRYVLVVCCGCLILVQGGAGVPLLQLSEGTSWGIGLVVPEGSALSGGTTLDWEDVANLTAVVQLPDLSNVSAPTFAVVSVMVQDGEVMQVAFGILPQQSVWLVYAMYVPNPGDVREQYVYVANSSGPPSAGGDLVSLSIYQDSGGGLWWFSALNVNTSSRDAAPFGAATGVSPEAGDQESFALESYATESEMFRDMGNMTLASLLVDGRRVESGWYAFTDWDLGRNPLFVVGGGTPVAFVNVALLDDGRAVWYYSGAWGGGASDATTPMVVVAAAALLAVTAAVFVIRAKNRSLVQPPSLTNRNRLKYALSGFRRAWR